jgi:hypothetical protein
MGSFAAIDQLRLGLEQTEQFLAILDRLALEDPASGQVTDLDCPIQIIEQFGSESGHPLLESAGSDREPLGFEQVQGAGENPVGLIKECPVSLLKPRLGFAPFGFRDLVDQPKMFFHENYQMMMLSPTAHSEKVRELHRSPNNDSQTVADQAGIGGIVDVGFEDERIAADSFHNRKYESMSLGHDPVVDPLDGVGRDQGYVVAKKAPVEGIVTIPAVNPHDRAECAVFLGQVLKFVVVEIATESDGRENEDGPIVHAWSATIRTRAGIDVLCDGIEDLVAECGLTVNVLQAGEDGNDLVATAGIQRDVEDGSGTESKLGIEGAAHGEDFRTMDRSDRENRRKPAFSQD